MPTEPIPQSATLPQRFMAKIDQNGPQVVGMQGRCWLWLGATASEGRYGMFWVPALRRTVPAHRFSFELHIGPLSGGQEPDHLCKVTLCVNPRHLAAVTHKENVRRGDSPSAVNSRKTHCPRGHLYDETRPGGGRDCSICRRDRGREATRRYRARKRVQAA